MAAKYPGQCGREWLEFGVVMDFDRLYALKSTTPEEFARIKAGILALAKGMDETMDIETLEKMLGDGPQDNDNSPSEVMLYITCQLLLHIYRKLVDIDTSLGSIYSAVDEIRDQR